MTIPHLTVTRKIAIGYLLLVLFSLVAVSYALQSLRFQNRRAEQLIQVDIQVQSLVRNLRSNLLAQERLEKQFLILQHEDVLELLELRHDEFDSRWAALLELTSTQRLEAISPIADQYREETVHFRFLLKDGNLDQAKGFSRKTLSPRRDALLENFEVFEQDEAATVDRTLKSLSQESQKAFQVTLLLVILGTVLGTAVVIQVVSNIHRSVSNLTDATREIGAGSFDPALDADGEDEFGKLAREFREMGCKLRELEQQRLDAHPLTRLPGSLVIEREVDARIGAAEPFAHAFVDLDHFKAYNDRYGYQKGSDVIAKTGAIIREVIATRGNEDDLVGHIGGDDYVFLTTPDRAEAMAKEIIARFDREVPGFYSEEDRNAGFFISQDRFGEKRRFPLLSVSIAIVCSENFGLPSAQAISHECAKMKEHLKSLTGSNYLIDRRKG